jgi:hypothetical protein
MSRWTGPERARDNLIRAVIDCITAPIKSRPTRGCSATGRLHRAGVENAGATLKDKVTLVTGSSRGIGPAIAK